MKFLGFLLLGLSGMASLGAESLTFRKDILPILNRAGCATGACHSKVDGQNGFELSVFSFDPEADHHEIVHEARGRRIFPASPEHSLLLLKATGAVSHEGGKRFEPGSEFHKTLIKWIESGMPYSSSDEALLDSITVSPTQKTAKAGGEVQIEVTAHYSDGSKREVTHLSEFRSNEEGFAEVSEEGLVKIGPSAGEGVIIVRYVDAVAATRLAVPPEQTLPAELYKDLPVHNPIDRLAYQRHQEMGLLISEPCTDSEFLRRAWLDTLGQLPSAKRVRAFLASDDSDKRKALIEELLSEKHAHIWADHWATKWGDLIRPNTRRVGVKPVYLMDQWIRDQFRANRPYDEWVRELLTATGSTHESGPVALFRDKREPADLAEFTSRIFLGTRLECARCHHHPSEKWSQSDYFSFAAFFASMKRKGQGISAPISGEPEFWWYQPGGTVKHPVTEVVLPPRPPGGEEIKFAKDADSRAVLMDWMTTKENPFFAKAAVNRVWAEFFGRGLVHPVDDFRASNPPVNGPLLDWLAADFAEHDFDLKHLCRRILNSHLYQLSSLPSEHNVGDLKQFSRSYRRRLPAEVLHDAVTQIIGEGDQFEGLPKGSPAKQTWTHLIRSDFLDTFGRPDASEECPCERVREPSVVQALHLLNSETLQNRLNDKENQPAKWFEEYGKDHPRLLEEIYLTILTRHPTEEEKSIALGYLEQEAESLKTGIQDLCWALLNSAEFVFNH